MPEESLKMYQTKYFVNISNDDDNKKKESWWL